MRILLVHRYFWPDAPPYASMLRTIGHRLVAEGHQVDVLSAQPSYNGAARALRRPRRELVDGVAVRRVRLLPERRHQRGRRVFNTMLFVAQVCWHVVGRRDDVVMFSTMPPVVLGLAVRAALAATGRAGRYVYHCQDIHPEAAVVGGLLPAGLRYRTLRHVDTATCRRAAAIVVLSADMRDTMLARGVDADRVHVCNNFSLVAPVDAMPPRPGLLPSTAPGAFVVAFAGNLGRFQGLDTLIDAAWHLGNEPDVQWWVIGDGVRREDLRRRAGTLVGRTVHLIDHQPPAAAFGMLTHVDLAVVSLRADMHRVAFPSKTMTALMAGCRLLIVADGDSDIARMVRDADVGSDAAPGDAGALAAAVRNERRVRRARDHAHTYAVEHFSADVVCDRWAQLFKRLGDEVAA